MSVSAIIIAAVVVGGTGIVIGIILGIAGTGQFCSECKRFVGMQ